MKILFIFFFLFEIILKKKKNGRKRLERKNCNSYRYDIFGIESSNEYNFLFYFDQLNNDVGASSGIGESIARKYAKEGMIVVLAARRLEKLEKIVKELKEGGSEVLAVQCDVADQSQVDNLFKVTMEKYKRVDVLVNNAGNEKIY